MNAGNLAFPIPPGGALLLSPEACAKLAAAEPYVLRFYRDQGLPDADIREVFEQLRDTARSAWQLTRPRTSDRGSENLPIVAGETSSPGSSWLTTKEASTRLGISRRGVVDALQSGRIEGRQDDANSAWRVSEQSVEAYRCRRRKRLGSEQ